MVSSIYSTRPTTRSVFLSHPFNYVIVSLSCSVVVRRSNRRTKKCPSLRVLLSLQRFCYPPASARICFDMLWLHPLFHPLFHVGTTVAIPINGSYTLSLCTSLLPRPRPGLMNAPWNDIAIDFLEVFLRCVLFCGFCYICKPPVDFGCLYAASGNFVPY